MLLGCPTRRRLARRLSQVGAHHHRRRKRTRRPLACAASALPLVQSGLAGSFDPVWTAGAEGRFISGALRSPSRNPLVLAGRVLLLIVLIGPAFAPLARMAHDLGGLSLASAFAGPILLVLLVVRVLRTRR